jgi:hypothetical protein
MKYTLLDLVQKTLTYLDDFNVNTIDETEEAEQIVDIVNQVYADVMSRFPWPHLYEVDSLDSGTANNQLTLPTDVLQIDWIRYNKKDVTYKPFYDMQVLLDGRDTTLSNVDDAGAISDSDPRYWTSIDDTTIIFDSYDGALDPALSSCAFVVAPAEMTTDTDEPNIPERFHTTLLYGVIAEACRVMKGDLNQAMIYERKYEKGIAAMKRWARRVNVQETTMPNDYSRKAVGQVRTHRVIEGT